MYRHRYAPIFEPILNACAPPPPKTGFPRYNALEGTRESQRYNGSRVPPFLTILPVDLLESHAMAKYDYRAQYQNRGVGKFQ